MGTWRDVQDEARTRTVLAPAPGRALGADPHDFAGLYIRHRTSFTSHARRYLRDPRDADEVVQEAFLRLFLALPELETELQALAYCRRTITNLCIDRYRADARRPRLVALDGPTVDQLAEDDTGDPVVRAEDAALVREALSKLPPLHQAALVKREIEEKPLPVIADELDVPEDSVKHLLFRARRALRKLLAGTSVAPGADVELTRGLRPMTRGASGGLAGLLLLALLGLGSGPDLRAVPVVGVDLPDVLGVGAVADAVREAVRIIVPGDEADAPASSQGLASRPVSGSRALPAEEGPVAGPSVATPAGSTPLGSPPAAGTASATATQPVRPVNGRPTTVVTVVDGVPVLKVLPPTAALPRGSAPVISGTSTDRAPVSSLPGVTSPRATGAGRGVAPATPAGPAVPVAGQPARPVDPGSSGRSPRADDAAEKADAAAKAAAKAEQAAAKAADKAPAGGGAPGSDKAAEKALDKAERAADKAADKAADAAAAAAGERAADAAAAAHQATKAAEKADKAADKADKDAEKAAKAASDRAASDRAASRAAEVAADKAAERAAAAAAAAAQQAAAAALPATPVAPVPAP